MHGIIWRIIAWIIAGLIVGWLALAVVGGVMLSWLTNLIRKR